MDEWGPGMVGRYWCMACEPAADPITEILIPRPCVRHDAMPKGTADDRVASGIGLGVGLGMAEGRESATPRGPHWAGRSK